MTPEPNLLNSSINHRSLWSMSTKDIIEWLNFFGVFHEDQRSSLQVARLFLSTLLDECNITASFDGMLFRFKICRLCRCADHTVESCTSTSGNLSGIGITDKEIQEIASYIVQPHIRIKNLYLEANSISDLGAFYLANALYVNRSVELLSLGRNFIGSKGARFLANALHVNQSIRSLSLYSNLIEDEGVNFLAKALEGSCMLEEMDIHDNTFGVAGSYSLFKSVAANQSLSKLELFQIPMDPMGAKLLATSLNVNKRIKSISFFNCRIDDIAIVTLSCAFSYNCAIEECEFFNESFSEIGANVLGKAFANNQTTKKLRILNCRIGTAVNAFGEMLSKNNTLLSLVLRNNRINREGAKQLAIGLSSNFALEELWISDNPIGSEGAFYVGSALTSNLKSLTLSSCGLMDVWWLPKCFSLDKLCISGNTIGDLGAIYFAELLKHGAHIKTLDLRGNGIGENGAKALANGIAWNESLKELQLSENPLGDNGAVAVFCSAKMLQRLELAHINITANAAQEIANHLKQNKTLEFVAINDNPIAANGAEIIISALVENTSIVVLNLENIAITLEEANTFRQALATLTQRNFQLALNLKRVAVEVYRAAQIVLRNENPNSYLACLPLEMQYAVLDKTDSEDRLDSLQFNSIMRLASKRDFAVCDKQTFFESTFTRVARKLGSFD